MDKPIDIHDNDVLFGRGGKNCRHLGNKRLRAMARDYRLKYEHAAKKEKTVIATTILCYIKKLTPPGRFLKQDSTGKWEEVVGYVAREKVSQALRDAEPLPSEIVEPCRDQVVRFPQSHRISDRNTSHSRLVSEESDALQSRRDSTPKRHELQGHGEYYPNDPHGSTCPAQYGGRYITPDAYTQREHNYGYAHPVHYDRVSNDKGIPHYHDANYSNYKQQRISGKHVRSENIEQFYQDEHYCPPHGSIVVERTTYMLPANTATRSKQYSRVSPTPHYIRRSTLVPSETNFSRVVSEEHPAGEGRCYYNSPVNDTTETNKRRAVSREEYTAYRARSPCEKHNVSEAPLRMLCEQSLSNQARPENTASYCSVKYGIDPEHTHDMDRRQHLNAIRDDTNKNWSNIPEPKCLDERVLKRIKMEDSLGVPSKLDAGSESHYTAAHLRNIPRDCFAKACKNGRRVNRMSIPEQVPSSGFFKSRFE